MSFLCLPPEVPESLRNADLENVSPRNLHEYFYVDKETTSSSLSGSTLRCRKPMTREQFIFMFPHVLVADSREEAGKAIRGNPELLSAAEEALKASLLAGMDEPWAEHEALMVGTLANVCGLPREVASAALVQTGYDMVSALMLAEEYRENGAASGTGWEGTGEVPSDFKRTLVHANPSLRRLSPTSWQILHECHLRGQSLDGAPEGAEPVLCGKYTWSEGEDEEVVTVVVKAPAGVRKGDVVSNLSPTQWTLKVKGEEECLISGALWGVVMPDESFWTLDQNSVVMSLQKREGSERWEELIRGELHLKPETLTKAEALLAREEERRLEAVLAAVDECGITLSRIKTEGGPYLSVLQTPGWCCLSVLAASLLHRGEGGGKANFRCVQWVGLGDTPSCCLGWPLEDLEEGDSVVATL